MSNVGMPNPYSYTQLDVAVSLQKALNEPYSKGTRQKLVAKQLELAKGLMHETKLDAEASVPLPPVYYKKDAPAIPNPDVYPFPHPHHLGPHTTIATFAAHDVATAADQQFEQMIARAGEVMKNGGRVTKEMRVAFDELVGAYRALREIAYPQVKATYESHKSLEAGPVPNPGPLPPMPWPVPLAG